MKPRFAGFVPLLIWLSSAVAIAQTPLATVTGRVLDAKTGAPLPFATVYLNNSSHGTNADQQGVYRLASVPLGNQELVGSVLGYQTVRLPIRLTDTRPYTLDLKLEPANQSLAGVTVTAKHNQTWVRQFRLFSRELLGSRPQARQCHIINPNVLSFQEEKGHLYARASEPLLIENEALGYQLYYDLLHFDLYRGRMQFAGTSRFDEMKATDARQKARWQANRMAVYQGSLQHLMASLLAGTHEQAGYLIYQSPLTGEGTDRVLPFVQTSDRRYISREQAGTLFKPGELPFERRLISNQPLEVYYDRVYANNSPYHDSPFAYSMLLLPSGVLEVTTNGWITQGNGLDVRGYMGNDRLATLLPADWAPTDGEMLLSNTISAGKPARADAKLDSLIKDRRRQYERTAPLVYVQTDKAFYCTGDQIWLSAYVIDPARHLPIAGHTTPPLQIALTSATGKLIQHQWVRLVDGRVAANFRVPDSLASGTYFLRAYTDLDQPENGPAFSSSVPIYNLKQISTARLTEKKAPLPVSSGKTVSFSTDSLDVQFLPEGGQWIAGFIGRLGIKAVQPNGRGYPISGRIVDQTGTDIIQFSTNALGMGQVTITPQANQHYRALLDVNGKTKTVILPDAQLTGWSLATDAFSDSSRLTVNVRAMGNYSQQPVYITLQSREQLVYRQKWLLHKGEAHFSLSTATLPPGICRVTLWDSASHPRAERLVFIPERTGRVQMQVTIKPHYEPHQQVAIGLQFRDSDGYPVASSWSAAVVDADQLPTDTTGVDIRTYLLLTGELRGFIESPAHYLEPEYLNDLDNLLLTQGWRRFPSPAVADSTGGWTLSGRVKDSRGQPLSQKTVMVWLTKGDHKEMRTTDTDAQGIFRLTGLTLTDSVQVQARLTAGSSGATITFDPSGPRFHAPMNAIQYEFSPSEWLTFAHDRQTAWPALYRDSTARQLAEITVRATKPNPERPLDVERASLHGSADYALEVEPGVPIASMGELLDRVPGIKLLYRRNYSSFGSTTPLYIIDGVYADLKTVKELSPSAVSRIEVLVSSTTAAMYGARGANGVIAIYTRKDTGIKAKYVPSGTSTTVTGFVAAREFYVPRYEQLSNDVHTDRRDVLFWQPLGQSDVDGLARLLFPLSDTAKRLRIVLQGLTSEGVPMSFSWELPVR